MATYDEMATSFGAAAGEYERGRPDYPAEAVAWLLEHAGQHPRVADVGAGTGKLTRAVLARGADVIAVDPDAAMLERLRAEVPGVETLIGAAEQLNLPDESMDATVLGQAWHWVDPVAASREIGRIVRPGGTLGLIWNIRDDEVPWVARLTEIMHGSHAETMLAGGPPIVAIPFAPLEEKTWRWTRPMTRDTITAMVASRSYIIVAPPDERARIDRDIAALCDEIGAIGDATVDLPYVTRAFRTVSLVRSAR